MPVLAHKSRLAFYAVPKNACTSVKVILQIAETGSAPEVLELTHRWQGTPAFETVPTSYTRFCVIRNPIDRFLSGYRNRVLHYGELDEDRLPPEALEALELRSRPDIEFFTLNLEAYRALSPALDHHFRPQAYFLGANLDVFHEVFAWGDFDRLGSFLQKATGVDQPFPISQTGGSDIELGDLPSWIPKHLKTHYAGDYALLRDYYPFDL